jgi:hypothetical protein
LNPDDGRDIGQKAAMQSVFDLAQPAVAAAVAHSVDHIFGGWPFMAVTLITHPRSVWRRDSLVAFGHQLNRIGHSYVWQAGLVKEILKVLKKMRRRESAVPRCGDIESRQSFKALRVRSTPSGPSLIPAIILQKTRTSKSALAGSSATICSISSRN